ncbi:MAG TPA: hypothetical protein VHW24_27065 [Bryobacteraceae bacterium]|nr:hypothetical protein [Bryobacteraceae bacterium]
MVDLKELQEGASLGGVYTLERLIRRENGGALFRALTADGERQLLKVMPEQDAGAEAQYDTWQRSRHLRHEHLLYLRDVGRAEVADETYIYGAFEYPDDALATALEQGPLSEGEARGVLVAVLSALRYLHSQGMVHGAVDAQHIVAVGDTVKLTTDALRELDDLEGHLEDIRQMGELVRAMREPEELSRPFASIVQHATVADPRHRWSLAELSRVVDTIPVYVPPPPPPPVVAPVTTSAAEVAAVPEATVNGAGTPAPVSEPELPAILETAVPVDGTPVERERPAEPLIKHTPSTTPAPQLEERAKPALPPLPPAPSRSTLRGNQENPPAPITLLKWVLAAAAVLLLSIPLLNLRHRGEPEPTPQQATTTIPAHAAPPEPAAAAPAPPRPVETARPIATHATSPKPKPLPSAASTSIPGVWRVIAFTYRSHTMAAKKVEEVNSKWPDMQATIFTPKGRPGYYLVALGRGMNREGAAQLQRKARSVGLPHDTYIQNYTE